MLYRSGLLGQVASEAVVAIVCGRVSIGSVWDQFGIEDSEEAHTGTLMGLIHFHSSCVVHCVDIECYRASKLYRTGDESWDVCDVVQVGC